MARNRKGRTYSTRRKSYRHKRSQFKRKSRDHAQTVHIRGTQAISDRTMLKMTFRDAINVSTAIGSQPAWYQYRGNSPYDPDAAAGGNYANGFLSWLSSNTVPGSSDGFYKQYRVHSSKIEVKVIPSNVGQGGIAHLCLIPNVASYSGATIQPQVASERRYGKYYSIVGTAGPAVLMKGYMSTRKMFGINKATLSQDTYAGTYNSNPATQWYWNIGISSVDGASALACTIVVHMTYYVELFQPVEIL